MEAYLLGSRHLKSIQTLGFQSKSLYRYFGDIEMGKITGADIKGYIRHRQSEGRANATINRELAALSSAINYCNREWEWGLDNPVKGRLTREARHRERYLTRGEVGRLVTAARQQRHGELLADFIEIAVHTGCRRGELLGLEWSRVTLEPGKESLTLLSSHTKSGKPRNIPLNSVAQAAIRRRLSWRSRNAPGCPWVFARESGERVRCIRTGFAQAVKRVRLEDLRIHDLRHTAASWLVSDGVPLEVIKELLGHSSITMTERYAHLAPQRVREAVNRLGHNPVTQDNLVSIEKMLGKTRN
ncbi:tyrosine-type recombinase/integrase [Vreelandella venusta]|uniref:tyrosine-type recombinase/integrase n=1 Tax=Vreelandella venusta TaxID=44935 RepID=UPI00200D8E9D|nr:site-specific integrase [Halomonas venusta]UQI42696.1 site-specific integrase [Halomonas venusta]